MLGFSVECAVSRCSYVVVNDLWCLFCDSVWLPFCYAVCAARVFLCVSGCVGCDLWLLFILCVFVCDCGLCVVVFEWCCVCGFCVCGVRGHLCVVVLVSCSSRSVVHVLSQVGFAV